MAGTTSPPKDIQKSVRGRGSLEPPQRLTELRPLNYRSKIKPSLLNLL